MKIGFFTDGYLPQKNGVATTVAGYAKALQKKGHTVYIIAPKYPKYKDKKNVIRLRSLNIKQETDIRVALYLPERNLLDAMNLDFDIIHGHSGGPVTLLGWEVARRKKIPFVLTYHTLWSHYTHYFFKGIVVTPRMMEAASRIFGNACDAIIAPTKSVKKVLDSYSVKRPIYVVPNGLNLDDFKKLPKSFLHKKAKIPQKAKIVLFTGRLGKEKSIDLLIKAFQIIHNKLPETYLVIIGEGPEKEDLSLLAKELGILTYVKFLGGIDFKNMPKAYAGADVFAFASKTETQGMVVLEACAAGLPVVAVKASPFKELITDKENGLLAKYSVDDFAEKILKVLTNEKLQERLSKKGKKIAEAFSLEALTPNLEKIYTETIETAKKEKKWKLKEKLFVLKNYLDFVYK